MPIIVQTTSPTFGSVASCGLQTPTAQTVINNVSSDLLQRIAPEDPVLLSYVNRVQLQLLRVSRWKFLQSAPQRFVTQNGRSDYWIGTLGAGPLDVIETGLNLTDIGAIKTDTFYDRSNFRQLKRTSEQILGGTYAYRDGSSRLSPPRQWRNAPDTPCVLNLYPAPDNENNYQPQPEPPALSSVVSGSLPARIYFVRTTFVDSLNNESSASFEGRIFVPANSVLVVQPPQEMPAAASGVLYNRYNVYVFNAGTSTSTSTGSETLVNVSPLSNTVVYQEPNTGVPNNGVAYPTSNNVEMLGGYLIEFRYFRAKPQINSLTNSLLIPNDYLDVLISGTNYFAAMFLQDKESSAYWKTEYDAGVIGMIRDKNLFPRGPEFISPDPASRAAGPYYGFETEDINSFPASSGG